MSVASLERFEGCLLGLALGDAFGAPYEGGPLERLLWRLIGRTRGKRRWTDDTGMAIDLAEHLVDRGRVEPDDLARRFAESYRWSRGYGPGTAKMLKRVRNGDRWDVANRTVHADGSYGNGAAMRAPVVGIAFSESPSELLPAARDSAVVTHCHPDGIEGAVLIAVATAAAANGAGIDRIIAAAAERCESPAFGDRLEVARTWLESRSNPSSAKVRTRLGNGIAAVDSCVTAIYLAARFLDAEFPSLLDFTREVGGDVDTIGAMAGAVWGAGNGLERLPAEMLAELEDAERIRSLAGRLRERFRVGAIPP